MVFAKLLLCIFANLQRDLYLSCLLAFPRFLDGFNFFCSFCMKFKHFETVDKSAQNVISVIEVSDEVV